MRESIQLYLDAHTMGANDCRANRPALRDLPRLEQLAYDAGYRRAFRLACQRLDVADIIPHHFN